MLAQIDKHRFDTLIRINNLIHLNYGDRHKLLTDILESATDLCDGDASSIILLNKEENILYFEVALGVKGGEVRGSTLNIGEGIAGWVVQNNESLIVDDVANDARHSLKISQKVDYYTRTMMTVPMRINDECIGVIQVLNKKNGQYFNEEDLKWLEIFANQAAVAFVNTRRTEQDQINLQLLRAQLQTEEGYHTLIFKSRIIAEKLDMIDKFAQTDSSVFITGESGVGKELFAEQIHLRSKRLEKPLIRINCAAIPEGLLESELFGHVKGAFTSAVADREGRFQAADGGTLFLDEIGDLPMPLQGKLLRVLQEKTFEKVGSDKSIKVDVRIISATNRNIEALVAEGKFREDLYYRLNVLPLYIPPLRQRPEDIIELADFFLKRSMQKTNRKFEGFSHSALQAMLSYPWPGNIRELENCVERACVVGKKLWIEGEDLFLRQESSVNLLGGGEDEGDRSLKTATTVFKSHFIKKSLEDHNWNQTETAKSLDIQRTYLSRLIKELGITNPKE
jgi:Nif-specific regulatory protein